MCIAGLWVIAGSAIAIGQPPTTQSAPVEATSLIGRPLTATPPSATREKLDSDLAAAVAELDEHPEDAERLIWVGRRLGYLWRMRDAIDVFAGGIERYPADARFYRHRGHRYISVREFDNALADFSRAAELIADQPDEIEPDGMPNAKNIPLTTLAFNVYYHLGLTQYLRGDFAAAAESFGKNMEYSRRHDDNLVATTYWRYLAVRRLGKHDEAAMLLKPCTHDLTIIENDAYHRLLLMFRGEIKPEALLPAGGEQSTNDATTGYGVGMWYLLNGDSARAEVIFRKVVDGTNWPAFGFIAAEAELARMNKPD
jgi:tetratricopeptide (TPR) repeat protein